VRIYIAFRRFGWVMQHSEVQTGARRCGNSGHFGSLDYAHDFEASGLAGTDGRAACRRIHVPGKYRFAKASLMIQTFGKVALSANEKSRPEPSVGRRSRRTRERHRPVNPSVFARRRETGGQRCGGRCCRSELFRCGALTECTQGIEQNRSNNCLIAGGICGVGIPLLPCQERLYQSRGLSQIHVFSISRLRTKRPPPPKKKQGHGHCETTRNLFNRRPEACCSGVRVLAARFTRVPRRVGAQFQTGSGQRRHGHGEAENFAHPGAG